MTTRDRVSIVSTMPAPPLTTPILVDNKGHVDAQALPMNVATPSIHLYLILTICRAGIRRSYLSSRRDLLDIRGKSILLEAVVFVAIALYLHQVGWALYGVLACVWIFHGCFGIVDLALSVGRESTT
jgi:hypothetical protein